MLLKQESVKFFCKGLDSKCCRLHGSYALKTIQLCCRCRKKKWSLDNSKQTGMARIGQQVVACHSSLLKGQCPCICREQSRNKLSLLIIPFYRNVRRQILMITLRILENSLLLISDFLVILGHMPLRFQRCLSCLYNTLHTNYTFEHLKCIFAMRIHFHPQSDW